MRLFVDSDCTNDDFKSFGVVETTTGVEKPSTDMGRVDPTKNTLKTAVAVIKRLGRNIVSFVCSFVVFSSLRTLVRAAREYCKLLVTLCAGVTGCG